MNALWAKRKLRAAVCAIAMIGIIAGSHSLAYTQTTGPTSTEATKGTTMTIHATGTFEVKITPEAPAGESDGVSLGRFLNEKQFHGDLTGSSRAQMLTAGTPVKGSASYVAMERVTGTLHGRSGSFILQHSGIMNRGVPQLNVTVVPDSGTGQLAGLAGKMAINIIDGKHFYDFEYTLPEAH